MKKAILGFLFVLSCFLVQAQTANLTGKRFLQTDNIPGDTYIRFDSNSKAVYIMTGAG